MDFEIKSFEDLSKTELYDILSLRVEVFVVEQNCPYQECDGKDQRGYHIFAKQNGVIQMYMRMLEPGVSYTEASIGRVVIKKSSRGKGMGKVMMGKGLTFMREEMKVEKIRISAQAYLEKFYQSLGFKSVSNVYVEDGIPHIEMLFE